MKAVQGGDIATLVGDITLSAKRDIRNVGSRLTSGGAIALSAEQDILLDAQTVEVNNQNKSTGFSGWFSYGSEQTRWNNFTTQLSSLEGGSITAAAKRNLTGIGATLVSQTDLALSADGTVTFDAEQNQKYLSQSGWSFGWGFKGSDILETLATKGGQEAFQQYVSTNPMLAAVHQLATKKNPGINELLALGLSTTRTFGTANTSSAGPQNKGKPGMTSGWGISSRSSFPMNMFPDPGTDKTRCTSNPADCMMALGVRSGFRPGRTSRPGRKAMMSCWRATISTSAPGRTSPSSAVRSCRRAMT